MEEANGSEGCAVVIGRSIPIRIKSISGTSVTEARKVIEKVFPYLSPFNFFFFEWGSPKFSMPKNFGELEIVFEADGQEFKLEGTKDMLKRHYIVLNGKKLPVAPRAHYLVFPIFDLEQHLEYEQRILETFRKYISVLLAIKTSVGKIATYDELIKYVMDRSTYGQLNEKVLRWLPHAIENFPSVLEHVPYSFFVEKCPRSCSHQLVRHRLASYTQSSTRYSAQTFEVVSPVEVPPVYKLLYEECLNEGNPLEECRHLLPISLATSLIMTTNLRELLHIIELRASSKASPEIRYLALQFAREVFYDVNTIASYTNLKSNEKEELIRKIFTTKPFKPLFDIILIK